MSRTIDQQVVEMQFDNSHFERNVHTSMSTIDKLKQSLNLTGASKGLDNINAAAKNNNFGTLANSVEAVSVKFSALQVMGITALTNITNQAVNAGKRIVSALTIDPVKTGLSEYETKMNAIQVITANTRGKNTQDDITKALDELNRYADKTIYNFAQMTSNIGKFTAQGLDVYESANAVKGLANLAAASGASAEDMSRATYQMSQALSGYIKLMDWNSLRNANMATVELKNTLIDLAKVNGIAIDEMIAKHGTFEQTLSEGWLSGEMFTQAMNIYSGIYSDAELAAMGFTESQIENFKDLAAMAESAATEVKTFTQLWDVLKETAQSGWTQTWEIIIGDFDSAKNMLTKLQNFASDIINGFSDRRNAILSGALGSKWDDLAAKITEAGLSTSDFQDRLEEVIDDADAVAKLKNEYGSLIGAIRAGKVPVNTITKALKKLLGAEEDLADSTEEVTESVEDLTEIAKKVIRGDFGNGTERIEKLTEAGYDYAKVQNKVNELLGSSVRHTVESTEATAAATKVTAENADSLAKLSDEQLKNKGYTDKQIAALRELEKAAEGADSTLGELIEELEKPSGRTLLIESFKGMWEEISKIFDAISNAWVKVFGDPDTDAAGKSLYDLIEKFHAFATETDICEENLKNFETVVEGFLSAIDISWSLASGGLLGGLKIFNAVLNLFGTNLLGFLSGIATYIIRFNDWLEARPFLGAESKWSDIAKVLVAVSERVFDCITAFLGLKKVGAIFNRFGTWIKGLFGNTKEAMDAFTIDGAIDAINKFFDKIIAGITKLDEAESFLLQIFKNIGTAIQTGLGMALDVIGNLGEAFVLAIGDLLGLKPAIVNGYISTWNKIINLISYIGTSIKNAAIAFYNLEPIQAILKEFNINLKEAWAGLKETFGIEGSFGLDAFIEKIENAFTKLNEWIDSLGAYSPEEIGGHIISGIISGLTKGIGPVVTAIISIASALIEAFCTVLGIESPSKVMMTLAGFIIAGLIAGLMQNEGELGTFITNFGTVIVELFKGMFNSIIEFAKELDFGKLVAIALSGGLIFTIKELAGALSLFGKPLVAFSEVMEAIIKTVGGIGDAIKSSIKLRAGTQAVKTVAMALLILTGALWVISKIDHERLLESVGALFAVAVIMGILAFACKELNKEGTLKFGLQSASLAAVAFAILALAAAFKMISSIEPAQLATTLFGFVGVCVALIAVTASLSKVTEGCREVDFRGLGGVFTKFAIAMLIMVGVIKLMAMLKAEEVLKGIFTISLITILFRTFVSAFKGMDGSAAKQAGKLAKRMAWALLLMMGVVKIASMMSLTEVAKGSAVIIAIGALLMGFAWVATVISKTDGNSGTIISDVGTTMLKFAAALFIIALVIKILAGINEADLEKSIKAIYLVGGLCAALMVLSQFAGPYVKEAGLMLLEFSVSLLIMTAVILLLKEICEKSEGLGRAMLVITWLAGIFAGLIAVTYLAKEADKVKGMLITLIIAITVLSVAIVALSLIKDTKKVAAATAAITAVMAAFALLIFAVSAVSKMTSEKGWWKSLITIGVISAIVVGLAGAIHELASLDPDSAVAAAESLGVLLLSLSASMWILNHSKGLTKDEMLSAIGGIFLLSLIAIMLAGVISELKAVDPDSAIPIAKAVGVLLLALSASFKIITMNDNSLSRDKCVRIAAILIELTVIAALLATVLADMDKLDPNKVIPNATAIGILLMALSGALWVVSYSKTFRKDTVYKTAGILAEMGAILLVISGAIQILDGISPANAIGSAIAIGVLLAALAGAFYIVTLNNKALNQANMWNIAGVFGILAIMLPVVGEVIAKLASSTPDNAVNSAIALGILIDALAVAMIPLAYAGTFGKSALTGALALTAMAIPLAVFADTVSKLPPISEANVTSVKAIAHVLVAMSALMAPLAVIGIWAGKAVLGMLALTSMVVPLFIFGQAIAAIPDLSSKITTIQALTQLMAAMELLLIPLVAIGAICTGTMGIGAIAIIAGIGALTAMVIPMATFAEELKKLPAMDDKLATVTTLVKLMESMTSMMLQVANKPISSGVAVWVINEMIATVKKFGELSVELGKLMDNEPEINTFLTTGIDLMKRLAHGLGEMLGSIVTGIGDVVFDALPGYGTKLSEFMDNAGSFVTEMKALGSDNSIVTGATNLKDAVVALVDAASSDFWSFGSMIDLGEQLAGFMTEDVKNFFNDVEGINASAISGAKNIAETVLALAEASKTDSWNTLWSSITGGEDWSKFGEKLAAFGTAMIEFDNAISGHTFDESSIKAAKTAAELMIALQGNLKPIGGWAAEIFGEQDLGDFGTQMEGFGNGIRAFSDAVSGEGGKITINTDAITEAKDAGVAMAQLQGSIEPVDGLAQELAGTTALDTFGEDIETYADCIKAASDALSIVNEDGSSTSAINKDSIQKAKDAGVMLTELQKAIPEDTWFDGKMTLSQFGEKIEAFGSSMVTFSTTIAEVDSEKMTAAVGWADQLVSIAQKATYIDDDKIANFEKITGIGTTLKDYHDKISEVETSHISASVANATRLADLINDLVYLNSDGVDSFKAAVESLGEVNLAAIVEAFGDAGNTLTTVGVDLIRSLVTGLQSEKDSLREVVLAIFKYALAGIKELTTGCKNAGKQLVDYVINGIDDQKDTLVDTMAEVTEAAAGEDGAESSYGDFYDTGVYLVKGFAKGIDDSTWRAEARASAMAKAAKEAAEKALGVQSPSKVFYKIGEFVVKGFTNALDAGSRSAANSASAMADTATSGFSRAIGKISDLLNGEMDSQPTIRPVLDLSDVQSGAETIGSMFGNPSIGVMSNLNSISRTMNSRNQNGANDDVVSAINKLGSLLGNTSGNSYTINGITYNDDTPIAEAVSALIRATIIEGRV